MGHKGKLGVASFSLLILVFLILVLTKKNSEIPSPSSSIPEQIPSAIKDVPYGPELVLIPAGSFMMGVESLDEDSRRKVLTECGKACARSYTIQVFREVMEKSADLDSFLRNLSQRGSVSTYERITADTIRVVYKECGCDLVRLGLVKSPTLCACSAADLCENLEQALGDPVRVKMESSILQGASHCEFTVTLEKTA